MHVQGSVLIRNLPGSEFELVDRDTHELLVARAPLTDVLQVAAARGVTVWQQNVDDRGRPLGEPIRLLPPATSLSNQSR